MGDVQLSKDIITTAALEILDEYGLQDLTIRRLARHLNMAAGAMYWHFPSKQALLGAVATRILDAAGPATASGDWRADVVARSEYLRTALTAHTDGAEVVSAALAAGTLEHSPAADIATLLEPVEIDATTREDAAATLLHFILGATVDEQTARRAAAAEALGADPAGPGAPAPADPVQPARRLRRGVDIIVAGIGALAAGGA